jgi:hypothetical protein
MKAFTLWTLNYWDVKTFEDLKKIPKIYDMEDFLIEYDTQHRLVVFWIYDSLHRKTYLIT